MSTPIMDMPFGGTVSADDFRTGTIAAASRRHHNHRRLRHSGHEVHACATHSTPGSAKAAGKACIDYGLHMIVTDLGPGAWQAGPRRHGRHGARRRRQLQALHGLPQRPHGRRRHHLQGACSRPRRTARSSASTPRTARVIDIIVAADARRGKDRAHLSTRSSRSTNAEAEAVHRAIATGRDGRRSRLYRPSLQRRRSESRCARHAIAVCPPSPRPARSTSLLSIEDQMPGKSFEEAKYVFTPPLREKKNQPNTLGRPQARLICKSSPPTTAPSASPIRSQLGKDDFTKIPNGGPGVENRHAAALSLTA